MQKKLIALAVAGLASSAAFAQTNVVVYGVADGTFDYVWTSGRDAKTVDTYRGRDIIGADVIDYFGTSTFRQSREFDGNTRVSANSSYIGFKGSEDLGNGLKAIFQYELGFDFTNGSSLGGARDSFVGISHAAGGTVVLGNLTGPTRAMGSALDVFPGATGIGANSGVIGKIAGGTLTPANAVAFSQSSATIGTGPGAINTTLSTAGYTEGCQRGSTCTSLFDTRWANAIAYLSPSWGGFSFAAAYVANEAKSPDYGTRYNTSTDTEIVNGGTPVVVSDSLVRPHNQFLQQSANVYGYDLGAKWEGMGFMVGLTYNWAQFGDILNQEVDNLRFGAMYTAPNWSVRGMWEQTEQSLDSNFFYGNTRQQKYGLGGTFGIGKTTLLAQWYGANDARNTNDTGVNLWTVGALYNLSKRTQLKATWAYIDNDDNAIFDFGVNSAGGFGRTVSGERFVATGTNFSSVETTRSVGSTGAGAGVQGVQLGIRHSF